MPIMNECYQRRSVSAETQSLYPPTAMLGGSMTRIGPTVLLSGLVAGEKAMSKVEVLRELGSWLYA